MVQRELPFGESLRTTKKVIYSILDASISFYYHIHLPFRGRWPTMTAKQKEETIHLHASKQWENYCRQATPGSARYWEGDTEIDLVAPILKGKKTLVAECKWKKISPDEEKSLLEDLRNRFSRTRLAQKIRDPEFKIFSQKDLVSLD